MPSWACANSGAQTVKTGRPTIAAWPQFDPLREVSAFQTLLATAEAGRQRALTAFRETAGQLLLAQ